MDGNPYDPDISQQIEDVFLLSGSDGGLVKSLTVSNMSIITMMQKE